MPSVEDLKLRFKEEFPWEAQHPLGLRMRRILSWYERALEDDSDPDAQFIFCWIAYNSAYGVDDSDRIKEGLDRLHELEHQRAFFRKILPLDRQRAIHGCLQKDLYAAVQAILENEFIYRAFWLFEKGEMRFEDWLETLETQQVRIARAYKDGDTEFVLTTLFERLYVLRNQVLHGGATYKSSVNRAQVEVGAKVLVTLVPLMAEIMMDGRDVDWGVPTFPVKIA